MGVLSQNERRKNRGKQNQIIAIPNKKILEVEFRSERGAEVEGCLFAI